MRPEVLKVLHALLDGPFDADKLDYVQRDSLHAGNSAGRSVDEARLVDSVVIRSLERGIGIHESGLQAVQSLYTARERMFETVYWHRTNRAANRMFTEALSVLAEFDADVVTSAFGRDLFRLDDEAAIRHVGAALAIHDPQAADTLIGPLSAVAGRRGEIYMRNVTVATEPGSKPYRRGQGMPSETHAQICAMYDSFLDSVSTRQPAPWLAFEHEVRTKLRQLAGNVAAYEVVLDVPDARFETPVHDDRHTDLGKSSFWVWVDGTPHPVRDKDPLFAAVLDNWRMNARKIRVMLSPRAAANLAGQESSIMELLKDRARTYAADLA